MNTEPLQWSEEKQLGLQVHLTGMWAEDTWELGGPNGKYRHIHFRLNSPSLKMELKYALWYKFASGERDATKQQTIFCSDAMCLFKWMNQVAPTVSSLLEKPLTYWECSLRSYLVETKRLRQRRYKRWTGSQEQVEDVHEDTRICLLRQCYRIVASAYDDRGEIEKDCWDMRKMGLQVDLTVSNFQLNFAPISQPWLKCLAKEYLKYNAAVHSPGDCMIKLQAIREFSRFLALHAPKCGVSDIDRALIVEYLGYLRERQLSIKWCNRTLTHLRTFLETCVYSLQIQELTREQIIFDEDLAKEPEPLSREIPEEVLEQLRTHLNTLPTTILRMVTILLECGLRIGELCVLPLACLICDDKHEWYLRLYQRKFSKEHIIPLVDEKVVEVIQAQQQEMRNRWGNTCLYLFPTPTSHVKPYLQGTFTKQLNRWAAKQDIRDRTGKLYRITAHQFRHSLGMRLLNDGVPIEVISRLLGHKSLMMTQVYARVRDKKMRADLERVARMRKTVDVQGRTVKGDPRANDPDAQMIRKGVRGQTLPVGGCGRLIVLGECSHANKCLTCPMWLTSTEDLPALKSFSERAIRLHQHAVNAGNQFVVQQQQRIVANLAVRIKSLENTEMDGTDVALDDVLVQLRMDLAEAESALDEVRVTGLIPAAKYLERTIIDLKARIASLEETT
jgi:integrase/recombinase XerD